MSNLMLKKDKIINDWEEAIRLGIEYKEKYGYSHRWDVYKGYYRGEFPSYQGSTNGILPYNVTYSMARALLPNVYFRNPYINITPRYHIGSDRGTLDMHSKVVEATDNLLMQEMGVKHAIKSAILDCYFTNRGIWKMGYDSLYGYNKDKTETMLNSKGERLEYNINVSPGMPWCVRVDPHDFIVPYGTRRLDETPWQVHRIIRPLEDVKADKKYKNTAGLSGTHLERVYKDTRRVDFYKELNKMCDWVEIYEIRDIKRREVSSIVPSYGYIAEPREDLLQTEGGPFIDLTFNEDPDFYWGPSDCQIIEPQQLEMNEARTQAMLHRRVALIKFLVEEKGMDKGEVEKMLSENVGPVVFTKGKPDGIVSLLQPHIPPDLIQWNNAIREDVQELMGFGRQQMGAAPSGRRTAQEMSIVQRAHQLRLDERRDAVADALVDIIRKTNQIVFSRWDVEKIVQVVGRDGALYWIAYTPEQIRGEYNIRVDVESMTPQTKDIKKRDLIQLIGQLAKVPGAGLDYLLKTLLREYEWLDINQVLPSAPEQENGQNPMKLQDFLQLQAKMQANPELLGSRVRRTANFVGAR